MSGRVLIHVQHLLGIGHAVRAGRIAAAAADAGLDVVLASGGPPLPALGLGSARLEQLPPMRASDAAFTGIVNADGQPIDDAWRANRRTRLLALYEAFQPDVLVTELFPFGRRYCRFELLPLLDAARERPDRPAVICSVRDIVHAARKPGRAEETAAIAAERYDLVLVHGDGVLVNFAESFPLADAIADKIRYTGYVAPSKPARNGAGEGEIIVAAGGGTAGLPLLHNAIAARPHTRLSDRTWRLLAGDGVAEADLRMLAAGAGPGVIVERARVDYTTLLSNCAVSVSQAGYNTAMDVLVARARAVLVPFVGAGETEQSLRAERLAARTGGISVVAETELTPATLAAAIDAAAQGPRPDANHLGINMDGATQTARLLAEVVSRRASRTRQSA